MTEQQLWHVQFLLLGFGHYCRSIYQNGNCIRAGNFSIPDTGATLQKVSTHICERDIHRELITVSLLTSMA
jgi:hypothetical protein